MASENRKTKHPPEELYDCGIIVSCDKGDDDAQLEYLEY